jgi:centromere-localized protein 2
MAPPTEASILQGYLLLPSQLPAIISLQQFTSFFPREDQSSPQIRSLYRDLQQQRNGVLDLVEHNIAAEVHRGRAMRRAVIRTRREGQKVDEEDDDEVTIEQNVCDTPEF